MSFEQALQRGWEMFNAGRYQLASEEAARAGAMEPENPRAPYLLSLALNNLGQYEKAVEAADQVLAIAADWDLSHFARGFALLRWAQADAYLDNGKIDRSEKPNKRVHEAEQHLREAIRIDPEQSNYWDCLGQALHLDRRDEEAEEALRRALAIDPDDAWIHLYVARVQRERGDLDAAEQSCQSGLALAPNNSVLHWVLGWVLVETGRARQSLACFRESLRLWPHARYARAGLLEALRAEYWPYRLVQSTMLRIDSMRNRPAELTRTSGFCLLALFFVAGTLGSFLLPISLTSGRVLVAWVAAFLIVAMVVCAFALAGLVYLILRELSLLLLLVHPFGRLILSVKERVHPVLLAGIGLPLIIGYPVLRVMQELDVSGPTAEWTAGLMASVWLVTPALACWSATSSTSLAWLGRSIAALAIALWVLGIVSPEVRGYLVQGTTPAVLLLLGLTLLWLLTRTVKR